MTTLIESLQGISGRLVAANVPGLPPYWRSECERFYGHETAKVLVECVGRGGDKSRGPEWRKRRQ